MSLANSLTDVANLALARLGATRINSIDDSSEPALTVNQLMSLAVMEVQSDYPWPELVREIAPDYTDQDTETGYYSYLLPSDCIRVLRVVYDYKYFLRGKYLYCESATDVTIRYIAFSEVPADWSVPLTNAVMMNLPVKAAMPVTQNPQLHRSLLDEYERLVLARARRLRAIERQDRPVRRDTGSGRWMSARSGYTGVLW